MIEMTTVDKEGRAKVGPVILVPKDYVSVVRCENCRHDNNCEIQYAAQAGSKFFCAYGERREERNK